METVRIYEEDNYIEVAQKIFYKFELMQSCFITGLFTGRDNQVLSKAKAVIDELTLIDEAENINTARGDKRPRRKRVKPENSIGGDLAHKIFKYREDIKNGLPCVTIWRIQ